MNKYLVDYENAYYRLKQKKDELQDGRKRIELSDIERKRFERMEERLWELADIIWVEYDIIGEIKN